MSRQQSIKISPFEVDTGYIPRMPLDAIVATNTSRRSPRGHPQTLATTDGLRLATYMADTLRQLRISLQKAQEQQAAEANKHRRPHSFQEGDQVLVSTKDLPVTYATEVDDHRKALRHKYIGPFELGKRCG